MIFANQFKVNDDEIFALLDQTTSGPSSEYASASTRVRLCAYSLLTCSLSLLRSYSAISSSRSSSIASDQFRLEAKPLQLSPSQIEQVERDFEYELNSLRENPASYIQHLQNELKPAYHGNFVRKNLGDVTVELETREGVRAVDDAIRALQSASGAGRVVSANGLNQACRKSCATMGSIGLEITNTSTTYAHTRTRAHAHTHTLTFRSMTDFGNHEGTFTSLALFGRTAAREFIMDFLVSDGDHDRSFRKALLNPKFNVFGVGYGPHSSTYQTMICVVLAEGWKDRR
jgi:hypothetical protein